MAKMVRLPPTVAPNSASHAAPAPDVNTYTRSGSSDTSIVNASHNQFQRTRDDEIGRNTRGFDARAMTSATGSDAALASAMDDEGRTSFCFIIFVFFLV